MIEARDKKQEVRKRDYSHKGTKYAKEKKMDTV